MKDKQINIRVNEEILKTLIVKANAANMNKSEYIIKCILNSNIKVDNSKDISKLIGSVNKIGNNINQIAKNLNIANNTNKLDDINYNNLLDKLTIIEYQLKNILKKGLK